MEDKGYFVRFAKQTQVCVSPVIRVISGTGEGGNFTNGNFCHLLKGKLMLCFCQKGRGERGPPVSAVF